MKKEKKVKNSERAVAVQILVYALPHVKILPIFNLILGKSVF